MSVKYLIQENLKAKSYSKVERTGVLNFALWGMHRAAEAAIV